MLAFVAALRGEDVCPPLGFRVRWEADAAAVRRLRSGLKHLRQKELQGARKDLQDADEALGGALATLGLSATYLALGLQASARRAAVAARHRARSEELSACALDQGVRTAPLAQRGRCRLVS